MTTRLVHLSDLHFAAKCGDQAAALANAVVHANPDIVVVTGDVTRYGSAFEFQLAVNFVSSLPGRKLVLQGNHDVPVADVFQRLWRPFSRYYDHFPMQGNAVLETPDAIVVGINTAFGVRFNLKWSLGHAAPKRIAAACNILRSVGDGRLRIVACHRPLLLDPGDTKRSRTFGGPSAFRDLAHAGMDVLLHGHMHRAISHADYVDGKRVETICASTALSDRERGGTSGFNILDIAQQNGSQTQMVWQGGNYMTSSPKTEKEIL